MRAGAGADRRNAGPVEGRVRAGVEKPRLTVQRGRQPPIHLRDFERDLVGGAVERRADCRRRAVGGHVAAKRRVSTRLPPAVDSAPSYCTTTWPLARHNRSAAAAPVTSRPGSSARLARDRARPGWWSGGRSPRPGSGTAGRACRPTAGRSTYWTSVGRDLDRHADRAQLLGDDRDVAIVTAWPALALRAICAGSARFGRQRQQRRRRLAAAAEQPAERAAAERQAPARSDARLRSSRFICVSPACSRAASRARACRRCRC